MAFALLGVAVIAAALLLPLSQGQGYAGYECFPKAINATFHAPTGGLPYRNGDWLAFLGSTIDNCGEAITPTVNYFMRHKGFIQKCQDVVQIGPNAFLCDIIVAPSMPRGAYTVYMVANQTGLQMDIDKEVGAFVLV